MGFCDLCGCHGDYYDQMINLEHTILKHHVSYNLIFVCNNCYALLKQHDRGHNVFELFHFSSPINAMKYKGGLK